MYCSIAFPNKIYRTFTYQVPDELQDVLQAGMRVKASFGARSQIGYCIDRFGSLAEKPSYTIKHLKVFWIKNRFSIKS
ncbi:MAG: hypothetical protein U5N56_04225 [Candidatus Marinimicrobia bacterium]|nr:hypothetical protein [Candidatus Neomarinimicrobiota bacterium]